MFAKEYYESGETNGREYRNKTQFFDVIDKAEEKADRGGAAIAIPETPFLFYFWHFSA